MEKFLFFTLVEKIRGLFTKKSMMKKLVFPVVYKTENKLEVSQKLDLLRKDEIWGFLIYPNVVISKEKSENTWEEMAEKAHNLQLNGKCGCLISNEVLNNLWTKNLLSKMVQMRFCLEEYGIEFIYDAWIWSDTEYIPSKNKVCAWLNFASNGAMSYARKTAKIKTLTVVVF